MTKELRKVIMKRPNLRKKTESMKTGIYLTGKAIFA